MRLSGSWWQMFLFVLFFQAALILARLVRLRRIIFKKQGRGTLHTYSIDYERNSEYFQSSLFQPDEDRPWIEKVVHDLGARASWGCH